MGCTVLVGLSSLQDGGLAGQEGFTHGTFFKRKKRIITAMFLETTGHKREKPLEKLKEVPEQLPIVEKCICMEGSKSGDFSPRPEYGKSQKAT